MRSPECRTGREYIATLLYGAIAVALIVSDRALFDEGPATFSEQHALWSKSRPLNSDIQAPTLGYANGRRT
jgi:hypothetical protein